MEGMRDCDTCNKPFVDDEGWKRQCVVCWKKDKDWKLTVGDKAFQAMQDAYCATSFALQQAQAQVEERDKTIEGALHRIRALRIKVKALKQQAPPPALTQQHVRVLLKLCHPDKHRNSPIATEMTKWLLTQREK